MALARAHVFDEITEQVRHDFTQLKEEIQALKEEVKALSPTFFKIDYTSKTPLPTAIHSLPDDPEKLKKLLADLYQQTQASTQTAREYERRAKQYLELYEITANENERLTNQLKDNKNV